MSRRLSPGLATVVALVAGSAHAQESSPRIDYEAGQYEFPVDASDNEDDASGEMPLPAQRVIPARRPGVPPVFVPSPVVQPTGGQAPLATAPAAAMAPGVQQAIPQPVTSPARAAAAPVYFLQQGPAPLPAGYAQPAGVLALYPAVSAGGTAYVQPQVQILSSTPLPAGSQLVNFDSGAWLAACRERLAGYHPDDRSAAMAALGGPGSYAAGSGHCEGYLDWYMARAMTGYSALPQHYGQQYMLVPIGGPSGQR